MNTLVQTNSVSNDAIASLETETAEKYYSAKEFRRVAKKDLDSIFKKYGRL